MALGMIESPMGQENAATRDAEGADDAKEVALSYTLSHSHGALTLVFKQTQSAKQHGGWAGAGKWHQMEDFTVV